jgi:pilus assembly protein CpaC
LAGDIDASRLSDQGSRFLRIGLNKSVVIHLPAAARDVLVGNPEIVDAVVRSKNTAYLFARGAGQTNVFFFDDQGKQILALDLEVAQDMTALQRLIQRTLPGSRITVDTIGDNVVLGGIAATPAEAQTAMDLAGKFAGDDKKVMSTINVTGKEQVMLRVRVAEVQRDVLKQLGVDTAALFSIGKFALGWASAPPFTANPNGDQTSSALGLGYGNCGPSFLQPVNDDACGVIRAMERDGVLRTLAEPTLTAISGESAKFLAGGEFPVPVPQDSGNGTTITIEYKPFGVGLGFTPIVMSEGRISLKIDTEVSELSTEASLQLNGFVAPSLTVRRASTTVELPSGGSIAMAGLIKEQTKQHINGTPGLKNLPILGALFRSRDYLSNQTELVVIVTPFVVDPVSDKQLATPLDGFNDATDRQTILLGRLNKVYGVAGQPPSGVYHGDVGYIVE